MKTCSKCGKQIADSSVSGLCRSCSQQKAVVKREQTCLERYGVKNVMHVPEFVGKIASTMLDRYGVNCAMRVPKFRQKYVSTMNELYGVPYYVMTDDYLVNSHFRISTANKQLGQMLTDNQIAVEYEFKLDDKQYDIHILGSNILIEVDPSYTHNVIGNHWMKTGIAEDYHKIKSAVAIAHGYRCIHVFDWDDLISIVKMFCPKHSIAARKCKLAEVDKLTADRFLDSYHLQGTTQSSALRLGLYYEEELIQVMTFGKPRYNKHYDWELLRLCTKSGIRVVGGASKLFNHAIKLLNSSSIISYCDQSKFTGDVYSAIGMKLLRINAPQEVWSRGNRKILGSTLRAVGYDKLFNTNYGKGTSNEELMIRAGWLPVYDCGQAVYVLNLPNDNGSELAPISNRTYYKNIADSVQKSKERLCAFCGEPFIPASNRQIYCKRVHIRQCPVCGKEYVEDNVENLKRPPVACSQACRNSRIRETKSKEED